MANAVDPTTAPADFPSLRAHLETQYSIKVSQISQLDLIVFRVDRHDGPSWIARVFDPSCPTEVVEGDAEILRILEQLAYPAERCANSSPISVTPSGQHVLVTEFAEGRRPRKGEQLFPRLGDLLGRLNSMPTGNAGVLARSGGAWHHICNDGGPKEEIQAALALLKETKKKVPGVQLELYEKLKGKLEEMDDFGNLPRAFVHPDLVPSNVITMSNGDLVVIDWAGAGTGPRISSLGFLLWTAGHRSMAQVEAVGKAYSKHISLTEEEVSLLADAVLFRPLVLRCWEFCTGRTNLEAVMDGLPQMEALASRVTSVARKTFLEGRE